MDNLQEQLEEKKANQQGRGKCFKAAKALHGCLGSQCSHDFSCGSCCSQLRTPSQQPGGWLASILLLAAPAAGSSICSSFSCPPKQPAPNTAATAETASSC